MTSWWLCPLGKCPDGAIVHDGDGYDEELICCREGCDCRGFLDEMAPAVALSAPSGDAQGERAHGDGTAVQGSSAGDVGGKR